MVEVLTFVAIFFAFQTGYWIGRRQRIERPFSWEDHAVAKGWVHRNYHDDPTHYLPNGDYIWRD